MTAPTITAIVEDRDNQLVGVMPFKVELRGKWASHIKVERLQDQKTGAFSVKITAPKSEPLALLDQIARKVRAGVRVQRYGRGPAIIRHYA